VTTLALDAGNRLLVGKVRALEVSVARDALQIAMNRTFEAVRIDKDGDLLAVSLSSEVMILVACEAVAVGLGEADRGKPKSRQEQRGGDNATKTPARSAEVRD